MRVGQGIPPCCPFYSAGLTYPRRYLGFFHQHGWGLLEGVEPPIIRNLFLGWLLLPLAPSAIPMRVVSALTPINSSLL